MLSCARLLPRPAAGGRQAAGATNGVIHLYNYTYIERDTYIYIYIYIM